MKYVPSLVYTDLQMNSTITKFQDHWAAGQYASAFREIVIFMFAIDSVGSIFLRGGIWFGIAIVIMASTDQFQRYQDSGTTLKTNLGFFLLFLVIGGTLMYLLFGFSPFSSTNGVTSPS